MMREPDMARREIMLGIIGAGLLTAIVLARRVNAAEYHAAATEHVFPGEAYFPGYFLDAEREANSPGVIAEIMTVLQPDIQTALGNQNVRAFLDMIAAFEGGPQGYNALFGGGRFEDFSDHPRTVVNAGGYSSSAAGRYQIIRATWDDVRDKIGAPDFSPYWQDAAAVYLIRRRGALADVIDGNFDTAVAKVAKEWASLPGAGYGQPERSLAQVRQVYANAGGNFA